MRMETFVWWMDLTTEAVEWSFAMKENGGLYVMMTLKTLMQRLYADN